MTKTYRTALPVLLMWGILVAATSAQAVDWPRSSENPVTPLRHVTIEERLAKGDVDPDEGYRFVLFGDQRAQKSWPELMSRIVESDPGRELLFMLDNGDIVNDGRYGDQFQTLASILEPCRHLPYLVGVGNHEISHNQRPVGRENTAACLSYLDPGISSERLYYVKVIGPLRFLFLDTNDMVYGDEAELDRPAAPVAGSRAEAQMIWLEKQLAAKGSWSATVAVMHHPIIQSSKIHTDDASALWSYSNGGAMLPDMLADAGVDVIISGHTHSFENFRLIRDDGRQIYLLNVSGKPTGGFGKDRRRGRDIHGREMETFEKLGWRNLDRWQITQEQVMDVDEANQFVLIDVSPTGGMKGVVTFLDKDEKTGVRSWPEFRIR